MGLLMFKERSPDDKSPFRKNEFHVGKHPVTSLSDHIYRIAHGRITRDNLRHNLRPSETTRERRSHRRRSISHYSMEELESMQMTARQQLMDDVFSQRVDSLSSERHTGDIFNYVHPVRATAQPEATSGSGRETSSGTGHGETTITITRQDISVDSGDPSNAHTSSRHGTRRYFAPARHYYEDTEGEPYFEVTPARDGTHVSTNQPDNDNGDERWRVGSPDTEQAILREIRFQEDSARLFVDGPADTATLAPRMTISQADGLGDRRRSPSVDDNANSDAEANWNDLTETMIPVDQIAPSVSSSFASDGASSILSRSRPRSSLTNTTDSGSRTDVAEAEESADHSNNCPDGTDVLPSGVPRYLMRTSSLAPVRSSSTSTSEGIRDRPALDQYVPTPLGRYPGISSQGLESLDDLMDMFNNGIEVPAEMWAAVGITPHLALRVGASRRRRRNERL